jgi:hypothetical protein
MKKITNKILIGFLVIFGLGLVFVQPAKAASCLAVDWATSTSGIWQPLSGPIFSEANFLPGNAVNRFIRVTNNCEDGAKRVAAETINENDPNNFSSQLHLVIKQEATKIFDDTLKKFFGQGETYLSDVQEASQNIYEFAITFYPEAGNEYQEKSLGFDILVGIEGQDGGTTLPEPGQGTGGGGGGGVVLPEGLTIANESTQYVQDTSAIINWSTNYPATSWVIYAAEGETYFFDLSKPNYGYPHSNTENLTKVTGHSMTITGLVPGTIYHYRCVSHGSLAVSTEHSFTTLVLGQTSVNSITTVNSLGGTDEVGDRTQGGTQFEGSNELDNGVVAGASTGTAITGGQDNGQEMKNSLAFAGSFVKNFGWPWWLVILIILILLFWYWRKKNKKEDKK